MWLPWSTLASYNEITVFSASFEGLDETRIHWVKVPAVGKPGLAFHLTFFMSCTLLILFRKYLRKKKFDIIHSHHYGAPIFADVITSHFCEQRDFVRLGGHRKVNFGLFHSSSRARRFWAFIERKIFSGGNGKHMIAVSNRMKHDFMELLRVPENKISVIYSGVDVERFNPNNVLRYRRKIRSQFSLGDHTPVILFVGGDWERKGLPQAIKAISYLAPLKPNLLVVGTGDVSLFKEMASDLGVAEQVVFVGRSQEVWKYFAAGDVFLLPTLYEAFGLTVLEAMASGLPVLVSEKAGAAELIQDGYNGLILKDPTDVSEIAAKLEGLLLNDHYSNQLGTEARKSALHFSWESVAQQTVEAYKRIVT